MGVLLVPSNPSPMGDRSQAKVSAATAEACELRHRSAKKRRSDRLRPRLHVTRQTDSRRLVNNLMHLDLSDEETAALATELKRTIDGDRYLFSARIVTLKAILDKIEPQPVREPCPPLKV
jgi:hypothetical protein